MRGELVDVVERVLGNAHEVLRVCRRDRGFDGDAKGKDGLADLLVSDTSCSDTKPLTWPSAQSDICCSGRSARYIAVVLYHIGRPRKTTTAQKERMASRRSHMPSLDSGGGCFVAGTAFKIGAGGAEDALVSVGVAILESLSTACHSPRYRAMVRARNDPTKVHVHQNVSGQTLMIQCKCSQVLLPLSCIQTNDKAAVRSSHSSVHSP
jgi:hypothetical protein